MYKMFAVYGDDRLPAEYRGDDSKVRDTQIHRQVAEVLDQLSTGAQTTLWPFMIPSYYEGSWNALQAQSQGQQRSPAADPCHPWVAACNVDTSWTYVDGTHVRAWYRKDHPGDLPTAQHIVAVMDNTIWPQLVTLMDNKAPLSDAGLDYDGGDGRYDIAIVDITDYGAAFAVDPSASGCGPTATHIEIRRGLSIPDLEGTLAHEFMHSIQWMFQSSCWFDEYAWMDEASATWAEHYVFPHDTEQMYAPDFLDEPEKSLNWIDANGVYEYGAYLFFFYLHEGFNERWVRDIYRAATTSNSLKAIEDGLKAAGNTDLEHRWPEFVRRNWNVAPNDKYAQWDGLAATVKGVTRTPSLGAAPVDTAEMDVSLPYLSARYYKFEFTDDNVRFVTFVNGMTYEIARATTSEGIEYFEPTAQSAAETRGLSVQLLVKVANRDWQTLDVTDQASVVFCRDRLDGRLEELVVIYANSDYTDKSRTLEPNGLRPLLLYSNAGCWKWEGTVNVEHDTGCEVHSINSTLGWSTVYSGVRMFQPVEKYAELSTSTPFQPTSGTFAWTVTGGCAGCSVSGNGSWPVVATTPNLLTTYNGVLSGAYNRGFDLLGFSPLQVGTEEWICPDDSRTEVGLVNISVGVKATEHPLKVSADGKRISGTIDLGNGKVATLNLTAKRE